MADFSETDLYLPVRRFLEEGGWQVKAEVKDCDIAAEKDGVFIIVELKKAFNLKLVYQALERQSLTERVYAAIPRPKAGQKQKAWKDMLRLLKRLELGLLTVALDSPLQTVDVILEPSDSTAWKNRKKRQALEKEFEGRSLDVNLGGMNKKKIMTAYKERSLHLCCLLERAGKLSCKELREMGLGDEKFPALLGKNYDHWYERVEKGVYCLSEAGKQALSEEDYRKAVEYYRRLAETECEKGGL